MAALTMGFRRQTPGIGCTPILPRSLSVTAGAATSSDFVGDATHTRTITFDDLGPTFSPFTSLNWRGDSSSYVDVFFGVPISDIGASPAVFGAEFAPFVRYEWPSTDDDNALLSLDPVATAAELGLPSRLFGLNWTQPTALRFYDRGECSADAPWRMIADGFAPQIDAAITTVHLGHDLCDPVPSGNWEVTPILRPDLFGQPLDAFRISRNYQVDLCGGGIATSIDLAITGRFAAVSGRLQYRVESVVARVENSTIDMTKDVGRTAQTAVNAALPQILAREVPGMAMQVGPAVTCTVGAVGDRACWGALNLGLAAMGTAVTLAPRNALCVPDQQSPTGGGCAVVPNIARVYERPEGIELVLSDYGYGDNLSHSDRTPDPLYPLLVQSPGVCDIPDFRVTNTAPVGGYMGTVFEIPPVGTPLPFGDHP